MHLTFPNPSRSYFERGRYIQFHGYDGIVEVPFRVPVEILKGATAAAAGDDVALLAIFDSDRTRIESVAREAYSNCRKRLYVLRSSDFR